jgi:hypothetical protein
MAPARVASARRFGQCTGGEKPEANCWEKSPSFRLAERVVCGPKAEEWLKTANFRVWHTSCTLFGIPGMVPGHSKKHQGDLTMYANELSNRMFAAAFSVVISAAFFAYAIIPASPSLVA